MSTIQERFASKIGPRLENGCILWIGAHDKDGYGQIGFNGKNVKAHRLVLGWKLGRDLDSSEWALHSCDTPACVNGDHLRLGTNSDNQIDSAIRVRRGRQRLTVDDVVSIRACRSNGLTSEDISQRFTISSRHARKICQGTAWVHVA